MRLIPACSFVPWKSSTISSGRSPAVAGSDCSLADAVQLMAGDEKVRAIDIGDAWWQDVDTPQMLKYAERQMSERMQSAAT